ncbi:MAG: hypothetical protein P8X74_23195 [Reinekea sp.]
MSNPIADFLRTQEDRKRLQAIEQMRRQGESFIRVRYVGQIKVQIDSEGFAYNLRLHGLKDIEVYEQTNTNDGTTEWKGRRGARMLSFYQTAAGDIETDIWDDPSRWNRRFIATHSGDLYVLDEKLRVEIAKELDKPFTAELSRKEELEQEIAEKLKELEKVAGKETTVSRKQAKKAGRVVKNGVDKSTTDVDSLGVPRVADRRVGKGDSAAVKSSAPDS